MSKDLKIISFKAENFKRLVAVEIHPDGSIVEITGKNKQGKSSILDAIKAAFGGGTNLPEKPIHEGADKGSVRIDLGEFVITRKFINQENGEYTTSLKVENSDGASFGSPQAMIDKMLGKFSFDPMEFARMDSKKRFEVLKSFIPNVDFEVIEKANKADYDKRAELNKIAKEATSSAASIEAKDDLGPAVDEDALTEQLSKAASHNADIETRKKNREEAQKQITDWDAELKEMAEKFKLMTNQRNELDKQLKAAAPLPAPVDVESVKKQISDARTHNKAVEDLKRKVEFKAKAKKAAEEAEALTLAMEAREKDKAKKIEAADLPIPGLTLGDGSVLYNGIPFEQASDAEQIRVSVAIGMAVNPTVKVILIKNGSLMDKDSRTILADMAAKNGYQVWVESVSEGDGKVGFIIEDGHVKGAQA